MKQILLILTATGLMLVSQLSHARHAALLIDADSGNVLYEMEANQAWYPASLTKLMTLYMTFSALESGRLRLSRDMYVSSHAARQPTSKLGLRTWDTISVEDAILAIITRSANDAAVVLAEEIAGSERQFAIKMTATAHDIGMYGSHFMNATGLPHDWQTTTAHDMAILAMRIMRDFPQYYPYFAADSLYFKGREYHGINKFVAYYPGAEGMKTGYTCGSGYNLVASARQYGKRLIGVVLGGMSSSERYDHMFTMMDMGFSNPYTSYRSKNIHTMSKNSIGVPPYQLSCGHRPSSHYAARHHNENDDDDDDTHYVKKPSRSKTQLATFLREPERRPITKISIAGKTKSIVKEAPESYALAQPRKAQVAARNKSKTPNKSKPEPVIAKTNKTKTLTLAGKSSKKPAVTTKPANSKSSSKTSPDKKSGKPIQTASSKTKSKGYYSPTAAKKPAIVTSEAKKAKGYYNPDNSEKTETKTSAKKKKSTQKKS